jgi:hypothetical protein
MRKGNLTARGDADRAGLPANFRAVLAGYKLDAVRVVATSAMRVARNGRPSCRPPKQAIGYPIEIISGEEEGRLIYMGVANALAAPGERRLVIDIGGGSTELILGRGQDIERVESFSVGTVKQSLSFFVGGRVDAASFEAAILSARSHFEDARRLTIRATGSVPTARPARARDRRHHRHERPGRRRPERRLPSTRSSSASSPSATSQDRHAGPAPGPRRHHHRRPGDPDRRWCANSISRWCSRSRRACAWA